MNNPQPDRAHRAELTVTVTSRPDGGNYFDRQDFTAHVAGWLKAGLKGRHAIAEVTVTPAVPPTTTDRDRIAAAVRTVPIKYGLGPDAHTIHPVSAEEAEAIAAAVLAVLPAGSEDTTTTRADALRDFLWRLEQSAGDAAAEKFLDDNSELRRLAAETQPSEPEPVRHAPGTAILCPDCRAKGHSVCMAAERPRCPHCQLPHDLTPGSMPVRACESILASLAEAARLHDEGDHSRCAVVDCGVVRARRAAASAGVQTDEETTPRQSCACGQDGCEYCDAEGVDEETSR